ncbi:MAG: aminotransferase class III-fold pyridoxal phosphate-dependent enzyme [Deltaproteobacteria bacterium]|nr:aminotransferase class III-fold pyridoxal phosphate-dependent enzyme [Deltaproteobacteria bacterium]
MADYFYTWSAQDQSRSIDLAGGSGPYLEDRSGQRWLDLGSLSYQANLGFGHPVMTKALADQAQRLALAPPNANFEGKAELAAELLELAPDGFTKVFFTLGGAEAVENALKIARLYTGRPKVVSRFRSYHGATLGALAVTGDYRRPPLEPLMPGVNRILDCYCDRCPFGQQVATCKRECAAQLDQVLGLEGGVGAAIFEPVPGANGVLVPPGDYWPMLREACSRHGALLIADEVLTGFGRTGEALAIDHWEVVPDLIAVAKALTAGYAPLGAVLVHERVAAHFDQEVLYAGLTNYGHPLGIAAARAALEVYRKEGLYRRAANLSGAFADGLAAIAEAATGRRTFVRHLGLLGAVELDLDAGEWTAVRAELDRRRVLAHLYPSRGCMVFAPALNIEDRVLEDGLAQVRDALAAALGGRT